MRRSPPRLLLALLGVAWVALIGVGYSFITTYASTPGAAAPAPEQWPRGAVLTPDPSLPTLLLFVHPRCPCSRATLGELETLLAQVQARVRTYAFFYIPEDVPDTWVQTDLWSTAAALPGVTAYVDPAGREARRFGALTSGHALLYDSHGRLHFSGGITAARGHQGDNTGRAAIVAWIRDHAEGPASTPVFGCALGNTFDQPIGP